MASDRASRSLFESASGKDIGYFSQQRLCVRLRSPQGIETGTAVTEEHLAADEPMAPEWVDRNGMPQERHGAALRGPAQEDNAAAQRSLEVERPVPGKAPARWGVLCPGGGRPPATRHRDGPT